MLKKAAGYLSFYLVFFSGLCQAQTVLQGSVMVPAGLSAYYMKPAVGLELIVKPAVNSRFRAEAGIGYYSMTPTKDTFKTYTIESGGATGFLPGYYIVKSYSVVPISFGAEYKILDSKFSPFVGLDGNFFVISTESINRIETVIDEDRSDVLWELGVLPKIGVTYNIDNTLQLYAGIGYSLGLTGSAATQTYWKTFISIGYKFDEEEDD